MQAKHFNSSCNLWSHDQGTSTPQIQRWMDGQTTSDNCALYTWTVVNSYLKLVCLLSTSAYSALEVLHIMRYKNLLTYLLTLQSIEM